MNVASLLTSAGINIGICGALLSLYSVLRKQPGNVGVYFARRLAQERFGPSDPLCFDRLFPSASWLVKAWAISEEEILAIGGLDAVVFLKVVVFSIRIFAIAAIFCMFLVLPLNYYGKDMIHGEIHAESLDVFTIANVEEGSEWLWAHCLALYVITLAACILLYIEYKSIAKMRLIHITRSSSNLSHFAVLVRSIPWSPKESYSDSVKKFFANYHGSSYLSHQMVYRSGTVQKMMRRAEKMYKSLSESPSVNQLFEPCFVRCNFCGGTTNSFKKLTYDPELVEKPSLHHLDSDNLVEKPRLRHLDSDKRGQECAAAFVFFKTRYAAFIASQVHQSSNPMLWVTDWAPEPHDVYWSNLWIPYKQLWFRKIATLVLAIAFMLFFLAPVTIVQGMTKLNELQKNFPILRGILEKKFISHLVTGYLPSVVLLLFSYTVPPTMMVFAALEGNISRSGRKKSACCKVLYFMIWNVFFVSVLSGSVITRLNAIYNPKDIPTQLATAVPTQATFFTTYVLTSGWAGLCSEIIQLYALFYNLFYKYILWKEVPADYTFSFPYHTELPKLLLFGLLGFTCAMLAPLILPFLLLYFFLAYVVYRNQFLNVYVTKYESGGRFWPLVHNTTIFSLVLSQIIALSVFGLKQSPMSSSFTIPLVILTLLFNEYCRQRFYPIFQNISAQDLIEMDRKDELCGRTEELYAQLREAYCQTTLISPETSKPEESTQCGIIDGIQAPELVKPSLSTPVFETVPSIGMRQAMAWFTMFTTAQQERTNPR